MGMIMSKAIDLKITSPATVNYPQHDTADGSFNINTAVINAAPRSGKNYIDSRTGKTEAVYVHNSLRLHGNQNTVKAGVDSNYMPVTGNENKVHLSNQNVTAPHRKGFSDHQNSVHVEGNGNLVDASQGGASTDLKISGDKNTFIGSPENDRVMFDQRNSRQNASKHNLEGNVIKTGAGDDLLYINYHATTPEELNAFLKKQAQVDLGDGQDTIEISGGKKPKDEAALQKLISDYKLAVLSNIPGVEKLTINFAWSQETQKSETLDIKLKI